MSDFGWLLLAAGLAFTIGWWLSARKAAQRLRLRYRRRLRQVEREALQAVEAAARSEALLEALGSAESDALLRLDERRRIAWANAPAVERFEIKPEQAASLISVTGSAALEEILDSLAPGQPIEEMLTIGNRRYRVGLAQTADGEHVLAFRDETEHERLSRARRDMVANISHDLRTPLTAISLLVEALEAPELTPHERVTTVDKIRDQLTVLRRLAEGLVELNRIESGRLPLRLQPESIGELVELALEAVRPQLQRHQVRVDSQIDAGLRALVDRHHVIRVLDNLLENAIAASPDGSTVRIEARAMEDMVEIRVRDQGSGIQPQDLPRIFERFYRGDRSRGLRGSGLGLAIVKHIIERHGGQVWARNNPSRGATIGFTLPSAD